jgi:hypothetical protein
MMIGDSELKVNQAMMTKAIEFYLNSEVFREDIKVREVGVTNLGNVPASFTIVIVGEKEDDE